MLDNLAFWSAVNIIFRVIAITVLAYVVRLQFKEFEFKSDLQPLKRILFFIPLSIVITNIPQFILSWGRIFNHAGGSSITSLATVSNGVGVLLISLLLLLVYRYRGGS